MRLTADLSSVTQAGGDIERVSHGLQEVLHTASTTLDRAETEVGHDGLARAMHCLAEELSRAEHESVRAIAALGMQVQLAASAYREADDQLAQHVPVVSR